MHQNRNHFSVMWAVVLLLAVVLVVKAAQHAWDSWHTDDAHAEATQSSTRSTTARNDATGISRVTAQDADLDASWTGYGAISEHNLFRPVGWEPQVAARSTAPPPMRRPSRAAPERPAPAYYLTLTGIAQNGTQSLAVLEDSQQNDGYLLHAGDNVQDAHVSAIAEAHITLARGNATAQLALGESIQYNGRGQILLGVVASREIGFASPRGAASADSTMASETGDSDSQLSVLERMRARRRRELAQQ